MLEKVKGRLHRWEGSTIFMGGRITLIKTVLAAMPLNNLSVSKLPRAVEKQFISLFGRFLWGGKDGERKMARDGNSCSNQWKKEA